MSPKSRGRRRAKSKRRTGTGRPARRPASVAARRAGAAERLVREICRELRGRDALDAELMVSALLAEDELPLGSDADAGGDFGAGLVAAAGKQGTPEALGLLRCIAELSDARHRTLAARSAEAAAALVDAGVPAPAWVEHLGAVTFTGAWRMRDVFGDLSTVLVTFDRLGQEHGFGVLVDHTEGGAARDVFIAEDPGEALADLRAQATDPLTVVEELDPATTRRILEHAIDAADDAWLPPIDDDLQSDLEDTRALLLARLRTLPAPDAAAPPPKPLGPAQHDRVVAEFLGSPEAASLAGRPEARRCAELIVQHSAESDPGQPLRVGPAKLANFVLRWLPGESLDDAELTVISEVMVAWARWAGRRSGLSAEALAALDQAATELGEELPAVYADATHGAIDLVASYLGDMVEKTPDLARLQQVVARRAFVFPALSTHIGDEDFSGLDPSDPDECRLLIIGEHPEYQGTLDEPFFDPAVDEVNPRLHILVHEIVARQLWADDPPETWQAAQRLLASGMERHDVLHALAEVATTHVWQALHDQQPADLAAYRRDLRALGTPP